MRPGELGEGSWRQEEGREGRGQRHEAFFVSLQLEQFQFQTTFQKEYTYAHISYWISSSHFFFKSPKKKKEKNKTKQNKKPPPEFLLWHSRLRIQLQWLGLLQRHWFDPQCCGLKDPALLQLQHNCDSDSILGPGTSTCHRY